MRQKENQSEKQNKILLPTKKAGVKTKRRRIRE